MYYICGMKPHNTLTFHKYQGTGNDFVLLDNRNLRFPKENVDLIRKMCDRRFGIGADGLILLENDNMSDFRMVYFNSDGNESSMCGNGGRCIVAFAKELGLIQCETVFEAVDGTHKAKIYGNTIELAMKDVSDVEKVRNHFFLDTGSPHHVQEVSQLDDLQVKKEGAKIRYGRYGQKGSNINFVQQLSNDTFKVRTYERGVEDETLSCGTGVTAVALAMFHVGRTPSNSIAIQTKGGDLKVEFLNAEESYSHIRLIGPAAKVFEGQWIV